MVPDTYHPAALPVGIVHQRSMFSCRSPEDFTHLPIPCLYFAHLRGKSLPYIQQPQVETAYIHAPLPHLVCNRHRAGLHNCLPAFQHRVAFSRYFREN